MTKSYRQGQILNLIRTRKISTQEELARELKTLSIETTQVTLSRDLRELNVAKTPDGYREILPDNSGPNFDIVVAEVLRDVRLAQNFVILKTFAGNANALAVALDNQDWSEVAGTVAGDDTIFVACWDDKRATTVYERLLAMLNQ
jgi:transcriptional regulator of arginine metabolism